MGKKRNGRREFLVVADGRYGGRQDLSDFVGKAIDREWLSDDLNAVAGKVMGEDRLLRIS